MHVCIHPPAHPPTPHTHNHGYLLEPEDQITEDVKYGRRNQPGLEMQRDGPRRKGTKFFQPGFRIPRTSSTPESVGAVDKGAFLIQQPQDSERYSPKNPNLGRGQSRWRGPPRYSGYEPRSASANVNPRHRQGSSKRHGTRDQHPSLDQPSWMEHQRDSENMPRNFPTNMYRRRRREGSLERYTTTVPHPSLGQPRWKDRGGTKWHMPNVDQQRQGQR